VGEVGLADPDSDGDRLQHLRAVLPAEARVTAGTHPLFGRLLRASSFKRIGGVFHLVVELPDGSPGTIPAEATDVFGDVVVERDVTVLTVEGARRLRVMLEAQTRGMQCSGRTRSAEVDR
jgi:hypothetical protein